MQVDINAESIKHELRQFDGNYAQLMSEIAHARIMQGRAEMTYKRMRYAVEKAFRDQFRGGLEKKPTEDSIKMEVALDSRVTSAQDALLEAEETLITLEAQRESAQVKHSTLIQLSSLARSELEALRFTNVR
jgi:predicted RecB family nuclease